ncbi:uncharacterized protein K489DRAFT_17780 [Dissoconium aciculare CBS 342.82]|uniref:Secreted protein n=1 Tax=Dissoconium aciculare CBS 342.82 TaxID=1314786 RepID=A0A6J3MHR8_9PEZI|nr:uncharacterized protein K489DRAFT_17780 [Dissoconium aciculare CBS 342.82]KAF1827480.1 hypothetical protein K489DRAFT_17780 [Dissoconium aciculare CBS 342.82]
MWAMPGRSCLVMAFSRSTCAIYFFDPALCVSIPTWRLESHGATTKLPRTNRRATRLAVPSHGLLHQCPCRDDAGLRRLEPFPIAVAPRVKTWECHDTSTLSVSCLPCEEPRTIISWKLIFRPLARGFKSQRSALAVPFRKPGHSRMMVVVSFLVIMVVEDDIPARTGSALPGSNSKLLA